MLTAHLKDESRNFGNFHVILGLFFGNYLSSASNYVYENKNVRSNGWTQGNNRPLPSFCHTGRMGWESQDQHSENASSAPCLKGKRDHLYSAHFLRLCWKSKCWSGCEFCNKQNNCIHSFIPFMYLFNKFLLSTHLCQILYYSLVHIGSKNRNSSCFYRSFLLTSGISM